jgi:hypothetical protein
MLNECPQRAITPDVWRALEAAEWANQGVLPVAGGWLDQTRSILDAIACVNADRNALTVKHGNTDMARR